ncbi:acyl-CoA dehydrogenase family protein [Nocardia jinanensis]|uniref:Acyl-CoA dehydrogenase/oxidase C-terminal domain-containing protein n=1 Tax=Nocardia jinanensis TaxID=382504 RepID=A0A917VTD3_9NOCA|nr:acyl-CoA dehydrogenase family protein [Nocardia jinanensis]GGL12667.1 hypothetical protein GCM10011588_28910 [Nocardia jinanensis]
MQLSQPRADDGYSEIRATVDHMFAERPAGIGIGDLERIGWFDLHEEVPEIAVRALFEGQGAALASAATLDAYALADLRARDLAPVSGEPFAVLSATSRPGRYRGLVAADLAPAAYVFETPEGAVRIVSAADLAPEPVDTVDAGLRLVDIGIGAAAGRVLDLPEGFLTRRVRIGLSWHLLGLCARLLEVGVDHVTARHQFGQPIGAFQAVQHLLADAAVAVASGQVIGDAAQAEGDGALGEVTSLAAAVAASRALATTGRSVQQVLGAIGYTWEHEFHRFLRRGMVLDRLLDVNEAMLGAAARRCGVPAVSSVGAGAAVPAQAH